MKKIFIFSVAVVMVLSFSSMSLAAGQSSSNGEITLGSGNNAKGPIKLSNNVEAKYYSADGSAYAATTYSSKGNGKGFGVASDLGATMYKTGVTAAPDLTNGNSSDVTGSGWSEL